MSVLSTLFPGVSLIDLFPEAKASVAAALSKEQQLFVSSALGEFQVFLETEQGRSAVKQFVTSWQDSVKEKGA